MLATLYFAICLSNLFFHICPQFFFLLFPILVFVDRRRRRVGEGGHHEEYHTPLEPTAVPPISWWCALRCTSWYSIWHFVLSHFVLSHLCYFFNLLLLPCSPLGVVLRNSPPPAPRPPKKNTRTHF